MDSSAFWTYFVVSVVLIVGLFLFVRAFWLWYWKINTIVRLLTDIHAALVEQPSRTVRNNVAMREGIAAAAGAPRPESPPSATCLDCGAVNAPDATQCRGCRRFLR